jgi:hypothetical protein
VSTRLITVDELLEAPTGFDWNDVAESAGATNAVEVIEQGRVIDRASTWASSYLFRRPSRIDATQDTETARVARGMTKAWVDRDGWLWFKADIFPVLSVVAMQWALAPAGSGALVYNPLAVANLQLYGEGFRVRRVADLSQNWSWLRSGAMVQLTYVNGWPNAVFGGSGIASGSNVTAPVDTTLGMTSTPGPTGIGQQLKIFDGANSEDVTVSSVTDSTHVVLASVANAHAAGIGISAVPPDIKWGVILACLHFGRIRGTDAVTFVSGGGGGSTQHSGPKEESDALAEAEAVLDDYRRIAD